MFDSLFYIKRQPEKCRKMAAHTDILQAVSFLIKIKDFNQKIVPAELIIAKHRKGGLGTVNLLFELNMSSFKSQLKAAGDENE